MSEENPTEDLKRIQANLEKSRDLYAKSLDDIRFQQEALSVISPYWEYTREIPTSGSLSSTASIINLWASETDKMASNARAAADQIILTSGIATNVASSTGTLAQYDIHTRFVSENIARVVSKRLERVSITNALSTIDKSLADTFSTVWQYLSYPAFDPGRGPLVQMRQTFDHFLSIVASDGEVASEADFEPDEELKKRNGKGITQKQRVYYFANHKVINQNYKEAVVKSWQTFNDTYCELNMLHNRNRLDDGKVKSALTQGEVVLQEWLRALGKL
jgi:hypothetical protein